MKENRHKIASEIIIELLEQYILTSQNGKINPREFKDAISDIIKLSNEGKFDEYGSKNQL